MLIVTVLLKSFWVDIINTACYLLSRCIIKSFINKPPFEFLKGIKPNFSYLRPFGYKCFIHNNGKDALVKFDAKIDEGIFLGTLLRSRHIKISRR